MKNGKGQLSRRNFLQSGTLAAMAVGAVPFAQPKDERVQMEPNIGKIRNFNRDMRYRRMGNTDVYLSALCLGGGDFNNPAVAYRAIDSGVNCIHMGYDYKNGKPMALLAEVLKMKRDRLYVALKDEFPKDAPGDLDALLKMLGTERVDFIFFNRHKAEQVVDPAIRSHFESWKSQGKVSTCGLTTHGEVKACIAAATDLGLYSIIHAALPQSGMEMAAEELRRAAEKGIGIMPMKTMRDLKDEGLQIAQFKKLLADPAVTTVNRGMRSLEMLETYLKAIKETLTAAEDVSLYRYARMNRADACAMCGSCERACPQKIEIPAILRAKTYYHDQLGDGDKALSTYRDLSPNGRHDGNCLECRACEAACPNGIQIVQNLKAATGLFRTLLS
jgi:predicted aldo/keto reductase-like oxidoreductase